MKKASLIEKIMSALFPPKCPICRKSVSRADFCDDCKAKMPSNEIVRKFEINENINLKCTASVLYKGEHRRLIHRFKFEDRHSFAVPIASQMCSSIKLVDADVITFVPMSQKAKADRGYNQSEKLARVIGKQFSVKVMPLLKKTGKNQRQHDLNAHERIENVKNVFSVCSEVKGLNILLVDDIVTTGATLVSCAKELYKSGAKSVECVCFASTPKE